MCSEMNLKLILNKLKILSKCPPLVYLWERVCARYGHHRDPETYDRQNPLRHAERFWFFSKLHLKHNNNKV